ncbi:MAG: hypothetical protein B7Z73_04325, partial [Planctomycetia bacterium 21-64-5]
MSVRNWLASVKHWLSLPAVRRKKSRSRAKIRFTPASPQILEGRSLMTVGLGLDDNFAGQGPLTLNVPDPPAQQTSVASHVVAFGAASAPSSSLPLYTTEAAHSASAASDLGHQIDTQTLVGPPDPNSSASAPDFGGSQAETGASGQADGAKTTGLGTPGNESPDGRIQGPSLKAQNPNATSQNPGPKAQDPTLNPASPTANSGHSASAPQSSLHHAVVARVFSLMYVSGSMSGSSSASSSQSGAAWRSSSARRGAGQSPTPNHKSPTPNHGVGSTADSASGDPWSSSPSSGSTVPSTLAAAPMAAAPMAMSASGGSGSGGSASGWVPEYLVLYGGFEIGPLATFASSVGNEDETAHYTVTQTSSSSGGGTDVTVTTFDVTLTIDATTADDGSWTYNEDVTSSYTLTVSPAGGGTPISTGSGKFDYTFSGSGSATQSQYSYSASGSDSESGSTTQTSSSTDAQGVTEGETTTDHWSESDVYWAKASNTTDFTTSVISGAMTEYQGTTASSSASGTYSRSISGGSVSGTTKESGLEHDSSRFAWTANQAADGTVTATGSGSAHEDTSDSGSYQGGGSYSLSTSSGGGFTETDSGTIDEHGHSGSSSLENVGGSHDWGQRTHSYAGAGHASGVTSGGPGVQTSFSAAASLTGNDWDKYDYQTKSTYSGSGWQSSGSGTASGLMSATSVYMSTAVTKTDYSSSGPDGSSHSQGKSTVMHFHKQVGVSGFAENYQLGSDSWILTFQSKGGSFSDERHYGNSGSNSSSGVAYSGDYSGGNGTRHASWSSGTWNYFELVKSGESWSQQTTYPAVGPPVQIGTASGGQEAYGIADESQNAGWKSNEVSTSPGYLFSSMSTATSGSIAHDQYNDSDSWSQHELADGQVDFNGSGSFVVSGH